MAMPINRAKADAARERKLRRGGYTVLRIPASLVEHDLQTAVHFVREGTLRLW